MKTLIITCLIMLFILEFTAPLFAYDWDRYYYKNRRPYRDYWGNRYKHYDNLWKDIDRDGVPGYWDYNDRNPYIQNPYQRYYDPYPRNYRRWRY